MTSTKKNLSLTLFPFLQDIHHWLDVSRVNLYPKGMTLLIDGEMCELRTITITQGIQGNRCPEPLCTLSNVLQ
ncbi:MAG: hypothetical protein A2201_00905 [Alicyclobacillus sp. RIFOXYA1_FULL_53_8]|nr:MAG: hypothetical protein A2201_00905 [Alicyclobacillus sp. RIFOXYA1_FULL_53_8]